LGNPSTYKAPHKRACNGSSPGKPSVTGQSPISRGQTSIKKNPQYNKRKLLRGRRKSRRVSGGKGKLVGKIVKKGKGGSTKATETTEKSESGSFGKDLKE